jgi:hypothetical protein
MPVSLWYRRLAEDLGTGNKPDAYVERASRPTHLEGANLRGFVFSDAVPLVGDLEDHA